MFSKWLSDEYTRLIMMLGRTVVCSINLANVSIGTSIASKDSFRVSTNPFQSRDNGFITCTFFPKTFPSTDQLR